MNRSQSSADEALRPDRRRGRTRQACLSAFVELLLTTDYETITVNEVIDRAKVGRSTFYDHFTGKEDLLRQCISNPFGILADGVRPDADPARLAGVLGHFREQRRLVRRLLGGETRTLAVRSLAALIEQRLAPGWRPGAAAPVGLAALAVAEAQLGMLSHWLEHSLAECPPPAFARILAGASAGTAASFQGGP